MYQRRQNHLDTSRNCVIKERQCCYVHVPHLQLQFSGLCAPRANTSTKHLPNWKRYARHGRLIPSKGSQLFKTKFNLVIQQKMTCWRVLINIPHAERQVELTVGVMLSGQFHEEELWEPQSRCSVLAPHCPANGSREKGPSSSQTGAAASGFP